MPKFLAAIPLAATLLSGCVMAGPSLPPADPMPPADMPDTCGAWAVQGLAGQDQSALDGMRFSQPVRIIAPGTAVTMDFSPARLNIETDATGRILRAYCG
jgi:hypothetical protein